MPQIIHQYPDGGGYHTPPVSDQADLQKRLFKELHDHVWQFGAKRVAEMLSADGKGSTETLVNSAHNTLRKVLDGQASGWPAVGAVTERL